MKQTLRQLVLTYYAVYIAAIAAALSGIYILKSGFSIDPLSTLGTTFNSILIIFIIGSIPITLGYFNKLTKGWATFENEHIKLEKYKKAGTIRIVIVGLGLVFGVLFFYIMSSQSMIFCAGIAAIALFFCKPTEARIRAELNIEY